MPKLNMDDVCTACGKREPATGWYATFGIGLRPEWFCSPACFEKVADGDDMPDDETIEESLMDSPFRSIDYP
jgi:hypothetical protein